MRHFFLNNLPVSWCLIVLFCLCPDTVQAWGSEGHFQVGKLALGGLDEKAASRMQALLDTGNREAIDKACNWPDQIRETSEWEWSAPQHYVNIPRASSVYDRERDCPEGLCVTEAIKKYAGQLAEPRLDTRQRWEAFAWLCHLVGDLHQPLHTGYKDDRGGNYYEIIFQGQASDLHQFWDRILIRERLGRNGTWKVPALDDREVITGNEWNPSETDTWTSESHALVKQAAYPPTEHIQADFADQSWLLIQQQWLRAGNRLARIINASIGEGEVVICRDDGKENGTGK